MRRTLAGVLALMLLAVACGDEGGAHAEESPAPAVTTVDVPFGLAGIESARGPTELPVEIRDAVMDAVESYVRDGVVATLRAGEPEDLGSIFDETALASLDTDDGAAMLDRGAPAATGDITATAEPVVLMGLADDTGAVVLVSVQLDLEVVATTDDGELLITRAGDLTFAPAGGTWKVTAYRVVVTRDGADFGEAAEVTAP